MNRRLVTLMGLVTLMFIASFSCSGEKVVIFTSSYPSYIEQAISTKELADVAVNYDECTWAVSDIPITFDNRYGTPTTFQALVYNGDSIKSTVVFGADGKGSEYLDLNTPVTLEPDEYYLSTFVFSVHSSDLPLFEALTFQLYFDVYQNGEPIYRARVE